MVKVIKSVGAVRVYNPWNAVGAAIGIALLLAGIGFAIGWIANNDNGTSSSSAAPSDAAGRQAAYQQGVAAGRRQTASAKAPATRTVTKAGFSNGFKAGNAYAFGQIKSSGAYFTEIGSGKQGLRVGPHVKAVAGNTYWVCAGGKRICFTSGTAPSR